MVDLPVGRSAVLAVAILLAGCAASPSPLAVSAPQASNVVRHRMDLAITAKDRTALTRDAILLAEMGGGMSDRGLGTFAALLDPAMLPGGVEGLRQSYHANATRLTYDASERVAEVPAEYRIVEGIAYDQATGRLFIGTAVDGRLAYLHRGQWREVPIGSPRNGLFGMAIDSKRRLLWIATGAADETAVRDDPMSGLIAIDLDRLKVVERIPVSGEPGLPGDVAIGRDGTVYVSNSKTGAIQRHRLDEAGLHDLVPPGRFGSPQGMALSRDDRLLYVADYATGLWVVRLSDGRITPLRTDTPKMLDGIDGLVRLPSQSALLAVQNGTAPQRVLKLYLSRDGDRISYFEVREIVSAGTGDPSLGTLKDGEIWYVGDGQWERYGPGGAIKDGKPPRPTPILRDPADQIVITGH